MFNIWWNVRVKSYPWPKSACKNVYAVVVRNNEYPLVVEASVMDGIFWMPPKKAKAYSFQSGNITRYVTHWKTRRGQNLPLFIRIEFSVKNFIRLIKKLVLVNFGGGDYKAMREMKRGFFK